MKEYIKKFELRKVIILMCVIGSLFTLSIGSLGIKLSGKMNENANYIYTYREYTNLIEKINTNILKMKSETLNYFCCCGYYGHIRSSYFSNI